MRDDIADLYAAAIDGRSWRDSLGAIRALAGADILLLGAGDIKAPETVTAWTSGNTGCPHVDAGYSHADSWNPDINPLIAAGEVSTVGKSLYFQRHLRCDVVARSDFLQSSMIGCRLSGGRGYVPLRSRSLVTGDFVAKSQGRELDDAEFERFDHVVPHIGHALRLRLSLDRDREIMETLSSAFDKSHSAVFLVDRELRLVFTNEMAERVA